MDWLREGVTANTCFGTAAKIREKVDAFFAGPAKHLLDHAPEIKRRCHRDLQAQADALAQAASQLLAQPNHVDLTLVSV